MSVVSWRFLDGTQQCDWVHKGGAVVEGAESCAVSCFGFRWIRCYLWKYVQERHGSEYRRGYSRVHAHQRMYLWNTFQKPRARVWAIRNILGNQVQLGHARHAGLCCELPCCSSRVNESWRWLN